MFRASVLETENDTMDATTTALLSPASIDGLRSSMRGEVLDPASAAYHATRTQEAARVRSETGFVMARPGENTLNRMQRALSPSWERWLRRIGLVTSDRKELEEMAIQTLRSRISDLDSREWAERYLCGLAGSDQEAFARERRAQS